MTDHDQLFKELLKTAFIEFLELFMPDVFDGLDKRRRIRFLDKEIITDLSSGIRLEPDLLAVTTYRGKKTLFLVHVEAQATWESEFPKRMFFYYVWLHLKHKMPVYPIALVSYESPQTEQPNCYVTFYPEGSEIMRFQYRQIQLNRLNWRDYADSQSGLAAALICTMSIAPADRVDVELRSWDMMEELNLPDAIRLVITEFMGAYLPEKTEEQMKAFKKELDKRPKKQQEKVMELMTCWEKEARREGRLEGRVEGQREVLLRQLGVRLGKLDEKLHQRLMMLTEEKMAALTVAIFDIETVEQLNLWIEIA